MKKWIALVALLALLLAGCGNTSPTFDEQQTQPDASQQGNKAESVSVDIDVDSLFTQRDRDGSFDESKSARITLNGTSAACDSDAVRIDGSTVTITDEGTYILSGNLDDGTIVVNAGKDDKTQLVFSGVSVNSKTSAAVYILQADKVFLTLAEGTENTLSNGGSFVAVDENTIDGVIFSKENITLNGAGSLTIASPAGHGIVSKDELTVAGGSYSVTCANHAFAGKDSISIADATITLQAGKDGLHAENNDDAALGYLYIESGNFTITAEGDGISAATAMQIDGGEFSVVSGGGSANAQKQTSDNWGGFPGGDGMGGGRPGMGGGRPSVSATAATTSEDSSSLKGIKAGGDLAINAGTFTIDSADDAVHSNTNLTVTGGSFTVATGDDGFHADETLTVTAGTINISESYEGLEGLHIKVSGGDITLVASDDGLNAAGGTDESGFGGVRGDQFGGGMGGGRPGMGGGMSAGNGSIVISGGKLTVQASGDGIDANGTLEITGGYTTVSGPTKGDTATLDYDISGVISGGTFIGTGAQGMAQSFSDSEQGVLAITAGSQTAGTEIILKDTNGNTILSHTPPLDFQVVIISCPQLQKGTSYSITVGENTGSFTAG